MEAAAPFASAGLAFLALLLDLIGSRRYSMTFIQGVQHAQNWTQ